MFGGFLYKKEDNMPTTGERIIFKAGLYSDYSALTSSQISANAVYFCTDTQQLFVGSTEYTRLIKTGAGTPTSASASSYSVGTLYYDSTNKILYTNLSGSWTAVANNINIMTGASSSQAGTSGLTPTPSAGSENKFLKADATWANPHNPIDLSNQTVDLNDLYPSNTSELRQYYIINGTSAAANISHKPVSNQGFLLAVEGLRLTGNVFTVMQTAYTHNGSIYRRFIYRYSNGTIGLGIWTAIHPSAKRLGTSDNAVAIVETNGQAAFISDLNLLREVAHAGYYIGYLSDNISNVPITPDANSSTELNFGLEVIPTGDGCVQILQYRGDRVNNIAMSTYRRRYSSGTGWSSWTEDKYTDTTYSAATTSDAGLMSAADKTKLDSALTTSDIVVCTQAEYNAMQNRTALIYLIQETSGS